MSDNEIKLIKKYLIKKHKFLESQDKKCLYCSIKEMKLISKIGETKQLKSLMAGKCQCSKIQEFRIAECKTRAEPISKTIGTINDNINSLIKINNNPELNLKDGDNKLSKVGKATQKFGDYSSLENIPPTNYDIKRKPRKYFKKSDAVSNDKMKFFNGLYNEKTNYIYNNNYAQKNIYELLSNTFMKSKPSKFNCFHQSIHPSSSRRNRYMKHSNIAQRKGKLNEKLRFSLNNSNENVFVQTEHESLAEFVKKYVKIEYKEKSDKKNNNLSNLERNYISLITNNASLMSDASSFNELLSKASNDLPVVISFPVSPIKRINLAGVQYLNVDLEECMEFLNLEPVLINPSESLPYFKTEIVNSKINFDIINGRETVQGVSQNSSSLISSVFSIENSRNSLFSQIKDSNNLGVICYLCGRLFSSYSIHIHYYSCQKKWKRFARLLSKEITIPELPNPTLEELEQRILENVCNNENSSLFTIKDAYNDVMYENSKLNTLHFQKLFFT